MKRTSLASIACASVLLFGCSGATRGLTPASGAATRVTDATEAPEPRAAPGAPLAWAELSPATFAKAKAERRFIVLDGAAEWCHWCHVMEATTYHDPAVAKLLGERFIAVKVDVDARPDIEERYGAYGWPATVIFSPDAEELGKYRGYIAPDRFIDILRAVVATGAGEASSAAPPLASPGGGALTEDHLAWIARMTELELDDYYDERQGGWGRTQKAALAWDNAFALARAALGDQAMKKKVLFTLEKQERLIDPVWGGIYQYSAAPHWDEPHFEKLMTFQAGALDNYAAAYALTKDARWLADARKMRGYIDRFMTSAAGGFYTTQDADLNAHDRSKPFVDGHRYYPLDDTRRLALGVPRIDTHEYAKENGLAIAAYAALFEATGDATALASAKRAAERILATHTPGDSRHAGGVTHDDASKHEGGTKLLYLADNAYFGWGLMRLHDATHDPAHLASARAIAEVMLRELGDADAGGFFASTLDPNAVGVFARRQKPFEENVMAIRFLAKVAHASPSPAYARAIAAALRAIATPEQIKARGRVLGDFLLALDETRGVR